MHKLLAYSILLFFAIRTDIYCKSLVDGFKGIPFGSSYKTVKKAFPKIGELDKDIILSVNSGIKVEHATASDIYFAGYSKCFLYLYFIDKVFEGAKVDFDSRFNQSEYHTLAKLLVAKYGKATKQSMAPSGKMTSEWGKQSKISLNYEPPLAHWGQYGSISYYSLRLNRTRYRTTEEYRRSRLQDL